MFKKLYSFITDIWYDCIVHKVIENIKSNLLSII